MGGSNYGGGGYGGSNYGGYLGSGMGYAPAFGSWQQMMQAPGWDYLAPLALQLMNQPMGQPLGGVVGR